MPRPARSINEQQGTLLCTKCGEQRPSTWFWNDKYSPSGKTRVCRVCRKKNNKVELITPHWEVVSRPEEKRATLAVKVAPGSWERVVHHVRLLSSDVVIFIRCENSYRTHNTVEQGVRNAAKKLQVKVYIDHGDQGVYVANGKVLTPEVKLIGRPDASNWGRVA